MRNTEKWLADNPHLPPGWGWHWRRWIQLEKDGRLREDYERQFVSPERANELVGDGTCAVDTTIAAWLAGRQARPAAGIRLWSGWLQQIFRSLHARQTKRDAMMRDALPVMRPKLPAAGSVLPYLSGIDGARVYSNFGPLAMQLENRLAAHFGVADNADYDRRERARWALRSRSRRSSVRPGTLCVIPAPAVAA